MHTDSSSRDKKREQFASDKKKSTSKPIMAIVAVLVLGAAGFLMMRGGDAPGRVELNAESPEFRIPLKDLESGRARFYTHRLADNSTVRFFVIMSNDGRYRAALDACDVCFHAKKGYSQDGDDMICNQCGMRFNSELINEMSGGCNPIGLPREVVGGDLVIKASDLEKGAGYF